jgi:hypothetical protein
LVNVTDVGVPRSGVTKVGDVDRTLLPEPVEVVTPVPPLPTGSVPVTPVVRGSPVALVSVPEEGVPNTPPLTTTAPEEPTLTERAVATLVPKPLTPVETGSPVALVSVALVGVPKIGVTSVGDVDKTLLPEPVEVVTPVPPFNTGRVPVTPVVRGSPVALVSVADVGVPKIGVTSVGEVARTLLPEPVEVVTPVPPFSTGRVPATPVVSGRPVAFVKVPDDGVPNTPPLTTGEPAEPTLTAKAAATLVPRPDTPVEMGKPVALVRVALVGVPSRGVTNVGEVANTLLPVPVFVTDTKPLLASVATALEAVRELRMGWAVSVAAPVTARVPPTLALPAKKASLYLREEVPRSTVLVTLGYKAMAEAITSCNGPILVMGAPSAAVPS